MQLGKYYRSSLSGLTLRYKGIVVGINVQGNEARVWAERVFKVIDERMAYKTENFLDAEYKFKEDGEPVIKFAEELEALVKEFVRTRMPVADTSSEQPT